MTVRSFLIEHNLVEPHMVPNSSGEFALKCVSCDSGKEKMYVNGDGRGVHCKICGFSSGWKAFTRRYEPPTPEEAALELFVTQCQKSLSDNKDVLNYLLERGLKEETIVERRLGFCDGVDPNDIQQFSCAGLIDDYDNFVLRDRITIPYIRDGYVTTVRGRAFGDVIEPKYLGLKGVTSGLYYPGPIDYNAPIFVSEGEFDAMMLNQSGFQAVGSPGTQGATKDDLLPFLRVYLCYDGDDAGRNAVKKFKKELNDVYVVDLPEGYDVSEYIHNFGVDSFEVLAKSALHFVENRPQTDDSLAHAVEAWSDWAWSNGELLGPKIGWAPMLENALSGWSRGLFLIGAINNSGKSCFLVKSAYEAAKDNADTIVVYLSLDDDQEDAITRLVSLHAQESFEKIRAPRWNYDHPTDPTRKNLEKLERFNQKLTTLKEMNNLIVRDAKFGRSQPYIRSYMESLRRRYPDKRIVVFIDSLAKVTAEGIDPNLSILNWKAYLAAELKYYSTLYDICIVTPTDFRKLNGDQQPTNDDLKDASELAYEANGILLGFNELSIKNFDPTKTVRTWRDASNMYLPDLPVLELNVSKNKRSLFRGTLRYKFYPPYSDFQEFNEDENKEMNIKINEKAQAEKSTRFGRTTTTGNAGNFSAGRYSRPLQP